MFEGSTRGTKRFADGSASFAVRGVASRCPHVVVPEFLGADVVRRLLQYVEDRRGDFRPALVYRREQKASSVDLETRNCLRLEHVGPFEAALRSAVNGLLPTALAGLGLLDRHAAAREFEICAYGTGGGFKAHHDIMPGPPPRLVSCVYYFFRKPPAFTGGELRLHGWPVVGSATAEASKTIDIVPRCDMLAVFPSSLTHEVRPVVCPSAEWRDYRFSINCWAYRSEQDESAGDPPASS